MPGRFALFTDENVEGPLVKALSSRGWDVARAVDVFGERTNDEALFAWAAEVPARLGRVDDAVARAGISRG